MPIEVEGVVSDYASEGTSEQQPGLTRDDMTRMIPQLERMPLTLDHEHPATAAAAGRPATATNNTIGRIVKAWIDENGCLRVRARIDDVLSATIGGMIRDNELTGFSLGMSNGMVKVRGSNELKHRKRLVECSITPNPEFKLTSFISNVRHVPAETAAATEEDGSAIDLYKVGAANGEDVVFNTVSASSGERTEAQRKVSDKVRAAVQRVRSNTAAATGKSNTATFTSTSAQAQKHTNAQQRQQQAERSVQMNRRQQQQQQNTDADEDIDDKQPPQYTNNPAMDRAIQSGHAFTQKAPRQEVSPVVINNFPPGSTGNMAAPPQLESSGMGAGAHARRQAQRVQYNDEQLAPLLRQQQAMQQQQELQQRMMQQLLANQQAMQQQQQQQLQAPRAQPFAAESKRKQKGSKASKEADANLKAQMAFDRSTGAFVPSNADDDDAAVFQQWLKFKQFKEQLQGDTGAGKKRGSGAVNAPAVHHSENPSFSLNEAPGMSKKNASANGNNEGAGGIVVDEDDDEETIKAKLLLARKKSAIAKKSAQADASRVSSTFGSGSSAPFAEQSQQEDVADAGDSEVKRLRVELARERAKSAQARVASIKSKMDAEPASADLVEGNEALADGEADLDTILAGRAELDELLEKDETGQIKNLVAVRTEGDRVKQMRTQITQLAKEINTLVGRNPEENEDVKIELENKQRQKQRKEREFNAASKKFLTDTADLIRKANNANNKQTPTTIKNKLMKLTAKPSLTNQDLDSISETAETVFEIVSASHDTSAVTLAEVKRLSALAKENDAKARYEANERVALERRVKYGADAQSKINQRDPQYKANRTQMAAAIAAESAGKKAAAGAFGAAASGTSAAGNGGGNAAQQQQNWLHLLSQEAIDKLSQQGEVQCTSEKYPDYSGYNEKTMRRNVPVEQMTPQDFYGLPYQFVPATGAAERATASGCKDFFVQKKRSKPEQVRGKGMHPLVGAHMTGDPEVLRIGVRDEIKPSEEVKVTRDMFSGQRNQFAVPNGRAKLVEGTRFVLLDKDGYARQ
jgi:hypothetical protein